MKTHSICRTFAMLFLMVGFLVLIGCAAAEQTITGTVEKTDSGYFLKTSDGANKYQLVDNQDFSTMVGKNVAITGTLLERSAGNYISVARFEVVGAGDVVKAEDAAKD
jgi:hypothetical protein